MPPRCSQSDLFVRQLLALLAVAIVGLGPATARGQISTDPAAAAITRLPIPPIEARKTAAAKVRDIFGADMAKAVGADAKTRLAKDLLGHAAGTADSADRYVLLDGAWALAMEAGNVDLVFEVLNTIAAGYAVDADQAEIAALETLTVKAPIDSVGKVVELLIAAAHKATAAGDVDSAEALAQSAVKAARRGKDRDLQKATLDALATIRVQKTIASREKALEDKVQQAAGDIEALTDLGVYRCFVKGDWEAGLPLLAKGSDRQLKELARLEGTNESTAAHCAALGDRWWEFSARAPKDQQAGADSRAQTHYSLALPELTGLEQARVKKRLEELERRLASSGKRSRSQRQKKGIVLQLDARLVGTVSGADGAAKNTPTRVTVWRDSTGPFKAATIDGVPGPTWEPGACNGQPGLVFTGSERLQLNCPVPPQGAMVVVCYPKSTAHQRLLTGPVGLALRADGSVWCEAKTEKNTERVMTAREGAYRPQSLLSFAASWPAPLSLTIGTNQPDAGPSLASPISNASRWMLGGGLAGAEPFTGCVQQVIVFDHPVTHGELSAAAPGLF